MITKRATCKLKVSAMTLMYTQQLQTSLHLQRLNAADDDVQSVGTGNDTKKSISALNVFLFSFKLFPVAHNKSISRQPDSRQTITAPLLSF